MSLYTQSRNGQTFPLYGITAGAPSASNSPTSGNGNASPSQVDLVAGAGNNPMSHAQAAYAMGLYTAARGAFSHPLVWAAVAVQVAFAGLAFISHVETGRE